MRAFADRPLDGNYSKGRKCSRCGKPITNGNQSGLCLPHSHEARVASFTEKLHRHFRPRNGKELAGKAHGGQTPAAARAAARAVNGTGARAAPAAGPNGAHAPARAPDLREALRIEALPTVADLPAAYLAACVTEAQRRVDAVTPIGVVLAGFLRAGVKP